VDRRISTLAFALAMLVVSCAGVAEVRPPKTKPCCSSPEQCLAVMEALPDREGGGIIDEWSECAVDAMADFGARALPSLIDALDDSDTSLVSGAACALVELGEQGRPAIPALIESCRRERYTAACWALGVFEDPRAVDVLVQHVDKGTGEYLESMADLAAERLIDKMIDPQATDQTLAGVLGVLKKTKEMPKGALPKLRTALRVELAASQLTEPEDCRHEPCRPRLASLLELAALWKRDAAALEPELLHAWRWKNAEVARAARSALAAAGAREVLPVLARALRGEFEDAQPAARDLARFASAEPLGEQARPAVDAIEHQLSRVPVPYLRGPFLRALGAVGGEHALALLSAELLSAVGDPRTAAQELAELGPAAEPALTDLRTLASNHWDASTRRAGAEAVSAITGEPFAAAPQRCPSVRETKGSYPVTLGERVLSLKPVEGQFAETTRCRAAPGHSSAEATFDDGRACLLSFSRGEWGGWTNVYDSAHEPYHLPDTQALRFLPVGDRLLVIHGLQHLIGTGWITQLQRGRDGRWTQSIIADLGSYPLGFAVDGDRLLLLIEPARMDVDDCERVVVALDSRNRLSVVQ
jgi:HEAT repeat protein